MRRAGCRKAVPARRQLAASEQPGRPRPTGSGGLCHGAGACDRTQQHSTFVTASLHRPPRGHSAAQRTSSMRSTTAGAAHQLLRPSGSSPSPSPGSTAPMSSGGLCCGLGKPWHQLPPPPNAAAAAAADRRRRRQQRCLPALCTGPLVGTTAGAQPGSGGLQAVQRLPLVGGGRRQEAASCRACASESVIESACLLPL